MRGRPVLGGISGFFFGLFLALGVQQFGLRPLDDPVTFIGLPLLFLVIGVILGRSAPFGRRRDRGSS